MHNRLEVTKADRVIGSSDQTPVAAIVLAVLAASIGAARLAWLVLSGSVDSALITAGPEGAAVASALCLLVGAGAVLPLPRGTASRLSTTLKVLFALVFLTIPLLFIAASAGPPGTPEAVRNANLLMGVFAGVGLMALLMKVPVPRAHDAAALLGVLICLGSSCVVVIQLYGSEGAAGASVASWLGIAFLGSAGAASVTPPLRDRSIRRCTAVTGIVAIPILAGALALQVHAASDSLGAAVVAASFASVVALLALFAWLRASAGRVSGAFTRIADRALASAGQGIVIAEHSSADEWTIVYCNDAFQTMTGFTAGQLVGDRLEAIVSATENAPEVLAELSGGLRDGQHRSMLIEILRQNDKAFTCRMTIAGIRGHRRGNDHSIALFEDVTAEQHAATARLELLAEASRQHRDAEYANRALDVFLASVTHDLRSPLNACLMWIDVVALSNLSGRTEEAVQAIRRNLIAQSAIIDDLIAGARSARNATEPEGAGPSAVDLDEASHGKVSREPGQGPELTANR